MAAGVVVAVDIAVVGAVCFVVHVLFVSAAVSVVVLVAASDVDFLIVLSLIARQVYFQLAMPSFGPCLYCLWSNLISILLTSLY